MANKPYRRRRGRKKALNVLKDSASITYGALANETVILQGSPLVITEDYYMISMDIWLAQRNKDAGQGPILIGIADADLTTGEITEAVLASQLDPSDIIEKERSQRPVRIIGQFPCIALDEVMNNGLPIRKTIKLSFSSAKGWTLWAMNQSGATLTTGGSCRFNLTSYGRWLR